MLFQHVSPTFVMYSRNYTANIVYTWFCRNGTHSPFVMALNRTRYHPHYVQTTELMRHLGNHRWRAVCAAYNQFITNEIVKVYLQHSKEKFKSTERRLKNKRNVLLRELKCGQHFLKEKVEEVIIERENVFTVPNILCLMRIGLSPVLGLCVIYSNFYAALGILTFAATTDLMDGWIARTWKHQATKMGSFLDPMADKVLITTLFLSLSYANLVPFTLTAIILAKDVLMIGAGFVIRYQSLPQPRTLQRYFDVTHATVQIKPTFISKVNTAVQLFMVGSTLAAPVFDFVGHPLLHSLWYITGGTTILAGISYVAAQNTYKFLKKK